MLLLYMAPLVMSTSGKSEPRTESYIQTLSLLYVPSVLLIAARGCVSRVNTFAALVFVVMALYFAIIAAVLPSAWNVFLDGAALSVQ
jgi:hypothetical protein